ncbi:MAG: dTDP-4-dehydrorhamnose 3,5-epimerase [Desulfosporosinus sp.]|nr:dTDP-4-dehydrorhamnose 3,5-epimerase [Desulfosporosinus sp.]
MKVLATGLPGAVIIEPKIFGDPRGFFMETWNQARYADHGLPEIFVQDNISFSQRGVLRGLHFQNPYSQGKLVFVLQGEVFDVAVDIRLGSPTFGEWMGVTLSCENKRQFYIPEGFAHGFCVTSDTALFAYKCTETYQPQLEYGVSWDDPDLGIRWPIEKPVLSEKDLEYTSLKKIESKFLPLYHGE